MKREDNEAMRNRILEAVIACKITASGAEVSQSRIASEAKISERTLNRYFPDKEKMMYDAAIVYLKRRYDAFAESFEVADKTGMDALDRLCLLIKMQMEKNRMDMNGAKVFVRAFTTALRTAVYRNLPVSGHDASVREIVIADIKDGIKEGSIRGDVDPSDMYLLISSNYIGLIQRLIYMYSVQSTAEEHKKKLLLVSDKYILMLREYLSASKHDGAATDK